MPGYATYHARIRIKTYGILYAIPLRVITDI